MIDPRGMDVVGWTDSMTFILEKYGTIGKLEDASRWQDWGAVVNNLLKPSNKAPPNPYEFTDWEEWAMALNRSLYYYGG